MAQHYYTILEYITDEHECVSSILMSKLVKVELQHILFN